MAYFRDLFAADCDIVPAIPLVPWIDYLALLQHEIVNRRSLYSVFGYDPSTFTKLHSCPNCSIAFATLRSS